MVKVFRDRTEAGGKLAQALAGYAGRSDVIVLALPRGGVPVGYEVARALDAPFDVFLVRKLGVPGQEELAMGAIASGGLRWLNEPVVQGLRIDDEVIEQVTAAELREIERRERVFHGGRPPQELRGKTVILVDDGMATGSTMHSAVLAVRTQDPQQVVVAVPVAAASTCEEFQELGDVDEVVCLETPEPFYSVGLWYDDFRQISDDEVRDLLLRAQHEPREPPPTRDNPEE